MNPPAHQPRIDAADYLAWEAGQSEKHEYLDGEVFAMAGASDAHVTVALNLAMALRSHLRGSPCSVLRRGAGPRSGGASAPVRRSARPVSMEIGI